MTIHRFFIPIIQFENDLIALSSDISWQLSKVLRLKKGNEIVLFDGSGVEYQVSLDQISPTEVVARKQKEFKNTSEPRIKISLYQSLLPRGNFEQVLQKATEMGVYEFIPIETSRTLFKARDIGDSYLNRWKRIIKEASEQSERAKVPTLSYALTFREGIEKASHEGLVVVPFEHEKKQTVKTLVPLLEKEEKISIFIGPEGGFTTAEIEFALMKKGITISLGPRILKSESAALMIIPIILYIRGELENTNEQRDSVY